MITLLVGENSFEIEKALSKIADSFDGVVEKLDGAELQLNQLPDILMGVSLFATARTIVIRNLGENKLIWPIFGDWLNKISDDINLVLVEAKVDKRTSTYKSLKDKAVIKEFIAWSDRDISRAEKWVTDESKNQGLKIDNKCVRTLVRRVGADQWRLFHALEKLSLVDNVTDEIIYDLIEPNLIENVFELLETAINGNKEKINSMINILEQTEEIHRLSALLFSQAFQLAAIASASKTDNPGKDFAIHPFVVSKLESTAKKLGKGSVYKIVKIFAKADEDMKTSSTEPWLTLKCALYKIASL